MRPRLPRTRPQYLSTLRTFAFSGPGLCCDAFSAPHKQVNPKSVHAQSPRQVECCAELKTATPPGAKCRNPVIPILLAKCHPEPDGRGHDDAIKPSSNTDRG